MRFANPYYLLGLLAAGLPIVIHLLTRDRVQRVAFSTLRFFVKASQKVLQRKKWQEILLLITRCLAVALVILALSRPFWADEGDGPASRAETARLILLDTSASMSGERFEAARQQVAEALAELDPDDDAAALVTFDAAPHVRVDWSDRFDDIRDRLALIQPGDGGTDLPAALRDAAGRLKSVRARRKQLVLVSDCQRVGWAAFDGDWSLPAGVELTVRPVAPPASDNLAIVDATVPESLVFDAAPRVVAARVANLSSAPRENVTVSLSVGDETVGSQRINLPAGGATAVRFSHVFTESGDNPGQVRIHAEDAIAGDNVYHFNARVIPKIRVVLVNGRATGQIDTDAALALQLALSLPLVEGAQSALDVRTFQPDQLSPDDLDQAMVAILADVDSLPAATVEALQALLDRGGGVLLLPGPTVEPETFNRSLAPIAPARLRQVITPRAPVGGQAVVHLTRIEFDHPVFQEFRRPHHGNLSAISFAKLWELADSQLSRVIARFDNSRPALLERRMGDGVSMMLAGPVGQGFNDLPIAQGPIFVSLVQEIVKHLSVRTEERTAYVVGESLPAGAEVTVRDPDGEVVTGAARRPGLHTVTDAQGERVVAVNRPLDEANPDVVEPAQIVAAVSSGREEDQTALASASPLADEPTDDGVGWYLLWAVAILLTGELLLANKTIRH